MGSEKLIKALKDAGIPCTTHIIKETPFMKQVHKDVEEFLKKMDEHEKASIEYLKRNPMYFKCSH